MKDKEAQLIWETLQKQKVEEGQRVQWPHGEDQPKRGSAPSSKDKKARPEGEPRPGQWRYNKKLSKLTDRELKRVERDFKNKNAARPGRHREEKVDEADYVPLQDDDALARAKQRGYDEPSDIDHHNQYMMDQDLLQPLHKAAQAAGAKDINDWMIQQIKSQGDNWVQWFVTSVISQENI